MKIILILTTLISSAAMAGALPVEVVAPSHADLTATAEKKRDGGIRVSGVVIRSPLGLGHSASHVEVDLVGARHQILASATDKIGMSGRHPRSAGYGREPFAVTFPARLVQGATRVRVIFHNHSHAICRGGARAS